MIEIIVLYFLCKEIGKIAIAKGLSAGRWKFNLVMGWIAGEMLGIIIGFMFFGKENLFSCILLALGCAATSYFIIKNYLSKLPDVISDDDLNNIGS
jgi:F0F1-type ATP synthase assembly protein I